MDFTSHCSSSSSSSFVNVSVDSDSGDDEDDDIDVDEGNKFILFPCGCACTVEFGLPSFGDLHDFPSPNRFFSDCSDCVNIIYFQIVVSPVENLVVISPVENLVVMNGKEKNPKKGKAFKHTADRELREKRFLQELAKMHVYVSC